MKSYELIASPSEFARTHLFYAVIGGFDAPSAHFHFERRYYPAYEILYITEGKGWYRQGDTWIGLAAGDCLLHNMRQPHAYRADPEQPFQMKFLVFDGVDVPELWNRYFQSPVVLIPSCPPSSGIPSTVQTILDWLGSYSSESEPAISILIYQLLVQSLNAHKQVKAQAGINKPQALEQAHRYMDSHYLSIGDINEVAGYVRLSPFHFIRQFKRYYASTPKEYILMKKIHHAKRLLLLTNLAIQEVGEKSGFNSYNSFLQAFHKLEQSSPSDFRKTWKRPVD